MLNKQYIILNTVIAAIILIILTAVRKIDTLSTDRFFSFVK